MNAGVPVRDVLASMGMTMDDLQDETKNTDGVTKKFVEQFLQMAEKDFPGAAARMATSWGGLANSISDIKDIGLREFFSSTFDGLRPMVVEFVDLFTKPEFLVSLRKWGEGIGNLAKGFSDAALAAMEFFGLLEKHKDTVEEKKTKHRGGGLSEVSGVSESVTGVASSMTGALGSVGAIIGTSVSGAIALAIGGSFASSLPTLFTLLAPKVGGLFVKIFSSSWLTQGISTGLSAVAPSLYAAIWNMFQSGGLLSVIGTALSGAFGTLGAWLAPVLSVIAPIASGFMTIVIPLLAIVAAAMLVYGVFQLWQSGQLATLLEPIRGGVERLMAVFAQMKPVLLDAWNTISSAFQSGSSTIATQVIDFLVAKFETITAWVEQNKPLIEDFVTGLATFFSQVIVPAAVGLWSVISPILGGLIDLILGLAKIVMQVLTGDFKGAWETAKQTVANVALAIWEALKNLWNWIVGLFKSLYDTLVGHSIVPDMMTGILTTIVNGLMNVIVGIATWVIQVVMYFYNLYSAVYAAVVALVTSVIGLVISWMANIVQKIAEGITNFINEFLNAKDRAANAIKNMVDAVVNRARGMAGSLASIGEKMVDGLINAIYNGVGAMADAISYLIENALDAGNEAAGIRSPSKKTQWTGNMMVEGAMLPFKTRLNEMAQVASNAASAMTNGFSFAQSEMRLATVNAGGGGAAAGRWGGGGAAEIGAKTVILQNYGTINNGKNSPSRLDDILMEIR